MPKFTRLKTATSSLVSDFSAQARKLLRFISDSTKGSHFTWWDS